MRRSLQAALACMLTVACSSERDATPSGGAGSGPYAECLSPELAPLAVVRVDSAGRRLFMAARGISDDDITYRVRALRDCLDGTAWAGRWTLSVFGDPALAGDKDEPHLSTFRENGQWARAFLAEYEASTGRLTFRPATEQPRVVLP